MGITRRFNEHPSSVDETYGEHMRVALHFSGHLAIASLKAAVHAFLPWMCCTSASRKVADLHQEMTSGARASVDATSASTALVGPAPVAAQAS